MKLLRKDIDKSGCGSVSLRPETVEDLWHVYNLVLVRDQVRGYAVRKVQSESSVGSVQSSRVKLSLTVDVSKTDFSPEGGTVRVAGRVVSQNNFVNLGSFHTLDIELNREFTLWKNEWDSISLDRLQEAVSIEKQADVAAVVMNEGLAYVCLITSTMTMVKAKIDISVPRKRAMNSSHERALIRFYDYVIVAIMRHIDFNVVKVVVVASPGFVKDTFFEHFMLEAVRKDWKHIIDAKPKFLLVHSSSGFKHSLKEVLANPAVISRLQDTKALEEVKSLERFTEMMNRNPDRAVYGVDHVRIANERLAIDTLLIVDDLFRSEDPTERHKFVRLCDSVRSTNGNIRVFSSMHVSGEQLKLYAGIGAILRYPLPDIDDLVEGENGQDDDSDSDDDEFVPKTKSTNLTAS